jgi:hypothetical protein
MPLRVIMIALLRRLVVYILKLAFLGLIPLFLVQFMLILNSNYYYSLSTNNLITKYMKSASVSNSGIIEITSSQCKQT